MSDASTRVKIAWLYGSRMNIYGDRGNVIALAQRARWRGIEPEVIDIGIGDSIPDDVDIFFFGGGQDQEQIAVSQDLAGDKGQALRAAIDNQAEALARFEQAYGRARYAVASGASMGGFVSAGAAQLHPGAFHAAVPMCGGLSGSVAQWNQKLDTVFVLERLIAPGLPVIDIPEDIESARQAWIDALAAAQATPEGRARIALAAATNPRGDVAAIRCSIQATVKGAATRKSGVNQRSIVLSTWPAMPVCSTAAMRWSQMSRMAGVAAATV